MRLKVGFIVCIWTICKNNISNQKNNMAYMKFYGIMYETKLILLYRQL